MKDDNTKEHNEIKTRIYVAVGGTIAVITSLIVLLITVWDKYEILKQIQDMVSKLIIHFKLG